MRRIKKSGSIAVYAFAMALLLGSFIAAGVSAQTPEGFFGGGRFSGSGSGGRTSCTFTPASGINFGSPSFACDGELLANYIVELNKFFYRLAIVLAVLMITIGGFQWLSAMGNASKIGNAKETIEQAVIGLALAFTAYLIFSQIDKSFVELKTLDITSGTIDARCDQFLDQDSCQRTEFHPDIQCSWDIAACPDGSQIPGRAPCCKLGSLTNVPGFYQIQGNYSFTDGSQAAAPLYHQMKCLSDAYGSILRVTEAYPPSV